MNKQFTIKGLPNDLLTNEIVNERKLKTESEPSAPTRAAYGELLVAELTPRTQITAQYGFTESIFTATLGGTVTNLNSMFQANSGTGSTNVSAVQSSEQVPYKAGQGLVAAFSAVFGDPMPDNIQVSGFINAESLIGFGYKDGVFGVIFASGGKLEIQELTITTGAGGAESATINIDGNPYAVPLTNIGIAGNAYEIATSLNAQVQGYDFTSNGATVECLGLLPELGAGLFSFSSSSAVGAFVELEESQLAIETLIAKDDWNVNPNIDLNPLLGNIYKVQYRYLGFGNISFFVGNPVTGVYELVHIIQYANKNTVPSVSNPIFRVGWATRNTGNTTNVTVSGGSAGIFVEGMYSIHGQPDGECHTQNISSGVITNILSIRNRMIFNNKPNRAALFLEDLSIATESAKITTFYIYREAVPQGFFTWFYENESSRIAEIATDNVPIIGGNIVACYSIRSELIANLLKVVEDLRPQESITIAAIFASGASSDVSASASFIEDL